MPDRRATQEQRHRAVTEHTGAAVAALIEASIHHGQARRGDARKAAKRAAQAVAALQETLWPGKRP